MNLLHGLNGTRFYTIWGSMKQRCSCKKHKYYHFYGGRGIKVCKRWLNFINFRDDMYKDYLEHCKQKGVKNTSIHRINNDSGYYKENCKWTDWKEQNIHRQRNNKGQYI